MHVHTHIKSHLQTHHQPPPHTHRTPSTDQVLWAQNRSWSPWSSAGSPCQTAGRTGSLLQESEERREDTQLTAWWVTLRGLYAHVNEAVTTLMTTDPRLIAHHRPPATEQKMQLERIPNREKATQPKHIARVTALELPESKACTGRWLLLCLSV